MRREVIALRVIVTEVVGRWADAGSACGEDPLLSNLPPCSCSSAPFGDNPAPQIPVRGARRRVVLIIDEPTVVNRVRIATLAIPIAWCFDSKCLLLIALSPMSEVLPPPPDFVKGRREGGLGSIVMCDCDDDDDELAFVDATGDDRVAEIRSNDATGDAGDVDAISGEGFLLRFFDVGTEVGAGQGQV